MRNTQQGFTLIELVVVIVILGILAATALPKFIDLSTDAGDASAAGTAAAISSGSSINFAKSAVGTSGFTAVVSGTATCATLTGLISGGLPTNVTWVDGAATITCASPAGAGGISTACKLEHSKGTSGGTTNTTVSAICTS